MRQVRLGRPTACRKTIGNATQPFSIDGEPIWNFAATSAFVERTVVRDVQCVPIPKDVPLTSAALVGCGVVTGMGAVLNRAHVERGQTAAVFGVGGVGLNVIQALRVKGALTIIAIDTVPEKEALAKQFGATHFLDGKSEDIVSQIVALAPFSDDALRGPFNAGGVNWAFDCVAHPVVTNNALEASTGRATSSSSVSAARPRSSRALHPPHPGRPGNHRLPLRHHLAAPRHPRIIDLYRRGDILLDELVSATYPIEQWETAVHDMEAGTIARGVLTL